MNWGKWIIVSFVLFAAFIGTLVTVCVRQDISLVSKDYYREELEFENQMIRVKNVSLLIEKPIISVLPNGAIQIVFDQFNRIESGELKLFRPSDAGKDKKYSLEKTTEKAFILPTVGWTKGMYRARMQWTMDGKEYFMEEVIYL